MTTQTEAMVRSTYTVEECSQLLGLSRSATFEGVHRGDIPHVRVGRRILIPKIAIDRMLNEAGSKADN